MVLSIMILSFGGELRLNALVLTKDPDTIEAIIHDFAAVVDFIAPLFFLLLNSIIQFGFNRIVIEILFLINFNNHLYFFLFFIIDNKG